MTDDALRELADTRRRELVSSWSKKRKASDDAGDSGLKGAPPQEGPQGDSREQTVVLPDTEIMDERA